MSDLIDRQKAINVIERMRAYIGHNMERAVGAAFIEILDDIGKDIGRLPSAQLGTNLVEVGTDTISRQAAIDAIDVLCQEHRYKIHGKGETYSQYNEAWQDALDRAEGAIFNLPTAQPEKLTETHACDCISRQGAIDAVKERYYKYGRFAKIEELVWSIEKLPSAQPEIIVCEDCKWRISENRKTTSLWLPCRALVTPDEFSCIYAERREVTE